MLWHGSYLLILALRGYISLDYPWMFGASNIRTSDIAAWMGIDLGAATLPDEAVALGYNRHSQQPGDQLDRRPNRLTHR